MRSLLGYIFLLLMGCSSPQEKINEKPAISKAQATIENLADSFNVEYNLAQPQSAKDIIHRKYYSKIDDFLSGHYLNHIRIHIDSMQINNLTIATRFHTAKNLVFHSSIEFKKPMPPREDSLFTFMKSLKINTDTSIDFMYTGNFQLNYSSDTLMPALVINAYPLSFQIHNNR